MLLFGVDIPVFTTMNLHHLRINEAGSFVNGDLIEMEKTEVEQNTVIQILIFSEDPAILETCAYLMDIALSHNHAI